MSAVSLSEITDLAIEEVDAELLDNLVRWKYNGGDATITGISGAGSRDGRKYR